MFDVHVVRTFDEALRVGARRRRGILYLNGGDGPRVVSERQHPSTLEGMRVGEITLGEGVDPFSQVVAMLRRSQAKTRR